MKKLLLFGLVTVLAGCTKYNETGLVCVDSEHDFDHAVTTLDVSADYKTAKIVLNGEKITLTSDNPKGWLSRKYFGVNAAGDNIFLGITDKKLTGENRNSYYIGVNSGESGFGCIRKEDIIIE